MSSSMKNIYSLKLVLYLYTASFTADDIFTDMACSHILNMLLYLGLWELLYSLNKIEIILLTGSLREYLVFLANLYFWQLVTWGDFSVVVFWVNSLCRFVCIFLQGLHSSSSELFMSYMHAPILVCISVLTMTKKERTVLDKSTLNFCCL